MKKFKNKYRTKSIRVEWWNYENSEFYFITISIKNRQHHFGQIKNDIMCLNEIGSLAYQFWAEIPQHFPFIKLDAFIIMPDHMHGILIKKDLNPVQTLQCNVCTSPSTMLPTPTHNPINLQMSNISPKPGSISTIIRSYNSTVTKQARKTNPNFAWHTSYYDHIIRDEKAYNNIYKYINNDPKIGASRNHMKPTIEFKSLINQSILNNLTIRLL